MTKPPWVSFYLELDFSNSISGTPAAGIIAINENFSVKET